MDRSVDHSFATEQQVAACVLSSSDQEGAKKNQGFAVSLDPSGVDLKAAISSAFSWREIGNACYRVTILEEDLTRMNPDMSAIEAYRKKEADYAAKAKELEEATAERDGVSPLPSAICKQCLLGGASFAGVGTSASLGCL